VNLELPLLVNSVRTRVAKTPKLTPRFGPCCVNWAYIFLSFSWTQVFFKVFPGHSVCLSSSFLSYRARPSQRYLYVQLVYTNHLYLAFYLQADPFHFTSVRFCVTSWAVRLATCRQSVSTYRVVIDELGMTLHALCLQNMHVLCLAGLHCLLPNAKFCILHCVSKKSM